MKTSYYLNTVIIVVYILCNSCEKTSNFEVPEYQSKLVLHSFISSNDTVIKVHVSTTKNVFGKLENYPKDLPVNVTLVEGDKRIPFSEMDNSGFCTINHKVEAKHEYKIVANCEGYPEASATCLVPANKEFPLSIDTVGITYKGDWGEFKYLTIQVKFADFPNENNYYNIYGVETQIRESGTQTRLCNIVHRNIDQDTKYSATKLLSDQLIDGKDISTEFDLYPDFNTLPGMFFNAYILETDANYYQYHMSLKKYKDTDDPFTEFSPIYSNVKGGFGIFSAYNSYKKTFKLK